MIILRSKAPEIFFINCRGVGTRASALPLFSPFSEMLCRHIQACASHGGYEKWFFSCK